MPPLQSTPTSSQVAPTWVAQLDSELQRASIPDRSIEAFEFSDILIQTLLSGDTSLDAEETDRIVSIITQDIERVTRILQPASLRTLAVLLVRSYFQHAQNIGLDLLVRASQVGNSGSKSPGIYFEKSDKVLVDQELGRCLYHLFNNGDQEVPFRRLAGKLFLAVTANVEDNADAFLSPSQAELSRTTDILTHGTDKILTFLASTILTSFCRCGINIPNIPQTERNFVEYVKASPGDTIENFYHHEQTKNDQQTNQATQACNLLQSLHIDGNPLVIGPIAASLSANALTLLYAVNATAGRCFDYLEIPLGAILDVSPLTIDSMSTLVLTLDSSMMTVNGPDNVLQGQKLRLTSKESLKDLETAIHAAAGSRRCGVREGIPVTRKTSSTLISLDLGNEIVRKSAGPNDLERHMDPDHESHSVANGQSACHVVFVSGTTCNEAVAQGDQSQTVSENALTIVHQDNVIGNREVGSSPNRGHQEQSQRPMSQAKAMCTEDQIETLSETEGKADAQNVQNAEVVQTNRVPENVIEKSDQNVRRNLPYQLRSLSSKTNPPAQFTNTQESLMFHRQKPGQKVYTSHSKAAVDWDEDLRQSSDNHDGTVEKETITSISSPFSGDGSIFDRRTSTAKRKRAPVVKASSKKKRKTNPRPRKKDVGTIAPSNEKSRASHQEKTERKTDDAEWSSADDAQTGHSGSKSEENHNPLTNHDQRHMERGGLDTAQYTLTTLKATDTQNMTELIKDSTGSDRGAEIAVEENVGVGNAIDQTPHEEHGDSLTTNEYGSGGRGKAVGRKLAAAFKDFDTQGSEGSFEQRVCDEAVHSIPLSAPDEGVESVHSTESSRIHQYSTQRLEPTISRSPCWNTMVSQSPRSSMRTESNGPDNPTQSTVFFDPAHIEMPLMGGSRPRNEVKQWKFSISAGGKSRNTTTGENGRRDLEDAVRRRSLPRDLRRIPVPILQRRSTPKRIMVDKNGSPQMIRRGATACTILQESSIQSKGGMRMKPVQLVFQGQGKGNESGYDGGSETDATEEAPERDAHDSSSPLCCLSPAHPLLERAAAPAGTLDGLDIDPVIQTDSKSTCELLETAHKRTQSILLASSERLACQLEDEKKAVNQVLEAYQRQCHQVLDDLFKTQEERIRLCEQQAESIRTHHARICQGLINRLEANGRMAHKRTLPDLTASQKDAAMDHD